MPESCSSVTYLPPRIIIIIIDGDDYSSVYELLTTYIFTDDPNTIQHLNVSIPITNDTINEGEESFFVVLDLVTKDVMGVELSHPEAEVVVHDDDGMSHSNCVWYI